MIPAAPVSRRASPSGAIIRRGAEAQAYRRWYGLKVWFQARKAQLSKQPLCERCKAIGRIIPAIVVNHRKPHKGDWQLFIDPDNRKHLRPAPRHADPARGSARASDRQRSRRQAS